MTKTKITGNPGEQEGVWSVVCVVISSPLFIKAHICLVCINDSYGTYMHNAHIFSFYFFFPLSSFIHIVNWLMGPFNLRFSPHACADLRESDTNSWILKRQVQYIIQYHLIMIFSQVFMIIINYSLWHTLVSTYSLSSYYQSNWLKTLEFFKTNWFPIPSTNSTKIKYHINYHSLTLPLSIMSM